MQPPEQGGSTVLGTFKRPGAHYGSINGARRGWGDRVRLPAGQGFRAGVCRPGLLRLARTWVCLPATGARISTERGPDPSGPGVAASPPRGALAPSLPVAGRAVPLHTPGSAFSCRRGGALLRRPGCRCCRQMAAPAAPDGRPCFSSWRIPSPKSRRKRVPPSAPAHTSAPRGSRLSWGCGCG